MSASFLLSCIRKKQSMTEIEDENKLVTEMMLKCINGESPRKVVYNYRHCFIKGTASVKILGDALEKLEATIRRPQYYGHTKNEFMRLTGGITK